MGLQGYFKNLPITTKFILWFLFIALVPLAIATYVSYDSSRKVLVEEAANNLFSVAENKAFKIETYLAEKEKAVNTLSYMSDIVAAMEKFNKAFSKGEDSDEYKTVDQEFRPLLAYYQKLNDYDDLLLINEGGDIIFSVKKSENNKSVYAIAMLNKDSELVKIFKKAKQTLKTEISDFEYNPESKQAAVFIAAPVFRGAGLAGLVVLQMSNKGISELVSDYAGLGKTGETVIAMKIKDEAVVITPLRFDADAAFRRKVRIESAEGQDIQKAVLGKKGTDILIDYKGDEVLSVWRYLPSFRLGMAVKMDTKEVLASAEKLRIKLLKISFALLAVIAVVAVLIARSVSRPIKELTLVSGTITGGDLSARVAVRTKDEIGELSQAFNHMTDSLVEAKASVERERAKLEEQKILLEKVNKELDSFVYTASHDLRAPLRGISSFASFLEEDYKDRLDEQGKDYLNEIRKGAERLNRLIEDLLKLSRISRIKNPYEDTDINELINSILERIKFDISRRNVEMKVQTNMPPVYCDRIKMGEAFLNLINNAVKFSSKNVGENPRIEVGHEEHGDFHKFFVRDNGIGIDPKYHSQIFGIFKRLHTSEEYEGTGAGLSIVKKVIDDHGGNIWVESEPGKGAAFFFTIPKSLAKEKKKLGQILIEDGVITEDELKRKLRKQQSQRTGIPEDKLDTP